MCRDYAFPESILCGLTRSAQNRIHNIECFAFKPNLHPIDKSTPEPETIISDNKVEFTDRQKWLKAYALQQLDIDPNQVITNLHFHACLVTTKRKKLLKEITGFPAIFNKSGDAVNAQIKNLQVGTDHVHLHIRAPPDYSPDAIVNQVVQHSQTYLKETFSELSNKNEIFFEKKIFCRNHRVKN